MPPMEQIFPAWMVNLYECTDFFRSCNDCWETDGDGALVKGKIPAKYLRNYFVICDGAPSIACSHCKNLYPDKGTLTLQIRRSSHHDVVKYNELQNISPGGAAGLQDYTINGNKVAFLTTRPVGRTDPRSPSCIVCQRELKDSNRLYCSLQCKHRSVDPQHCKRVTAFLRQRGCEEYPDLCSDDFDEDSTSEDRTPRRKTPPKVHIVFRAEAVERARHPRKQPRFAIRSGL